MFPVTRLVELGRSLPVDTDHSLGRLADTALVLLHLKPQDYPPELHAATERICVLDGQIGVVFGEQTVRLRDGEMLTIPPGERHAFATDSDAVVLAILGSEA